MKTVAIIGGGPAGLMAAEALSAGNVQVDLYESKASVGRKFLVAGKGGLNLTHAEPFASFLTRFRPSGFGGPQFGADCVQLLQLLTAFTPNAVREWCHSLEIETFIGPSGRVFPKDLLATPILQRWTKRLTDNGVRIHTGHHWSGWNEERELTFETAEGSRSVQSNAVILALGGASWPKLGSDGNWVPLLQQQDTEIAKLQPANCGFNVAWSDHFRDRFAGTPLKSVVLTATNTAGEVFSRQGSCVVTQYGLEGSLIYAASAQLRDEITQFGSATLMLDLAPDRTTEYLVKRLSIPRGSRTLSNHLKSKVNIKGVQAGLLREFASDSLQDPTKLAAAIKALPVSMTAARPIDEAISTAGGVRFHQLDKTLMAKSMPGVFYAGEMLDWEAPTGGYLLTACFATGKVAGQGALAWVETLGNKDEQPN